MSKKISSAMLLATLMVGLVAKPQAALADVVISGEVRDLENKPRNTFADGTPIKYEVKVIIRREKAGTQKPPIAKQFTESAYTITIPENDIDRTDCSIRVDFSSPGKLKPAILNGLPPETQRINVVLPDEPACGWCSPLCKPQGVPYRPSGKSCDEAPVGMAMPLFQPGDHVVVKKDDSILKVGSKVVARAKKNTPLVVQNVQGGWLWTRLKAAEGQTAGWISQANVQAASSEKSTTESRPTISWRRWTNRSGKQSEPAQFQKIDGLKAYFLTKDGQSLKTFVTVLSDADQQIIRKLASVGR